MRIEKIQPFPGDAGSAIRTLMMPAAYEGSYQISDHQPSAVLALTKGLPYATGSADSRKFSGENPDRG